MNRHSFANWLYRTVLTAGVLSVSMPVSAERLPIRVYTTADGLSQNQIIRIVKDSRGFIWFCTREGLSRFDGHTFVSYTQADGLPHRSVRDIVESRDGEYWIATKNGLVRWKPGVVAASSTGGVQAAAKPRPAFEVFSPANNDSARDVWRLFRDPMGTIWVGTVAGLFRVEGDGADIHFGPIDLGMPDTAPDSHLVQDVQMDRTGALWVATRSAGIFRRLVSGRIERYTRREGLPEDRVNTVFFDRDGHVWAGTSLGLARLDETGAGSAVLVVARVYTKQSGLAGDWIEAVVESPEGALWIGGAGGVSVLTGEGTSTEQIRTYGIAEGVNDYGVTTLIDDRSGNLWIGTESNGALRLATSGMTQYGKVDGIGTPVVGALFSDPRVGVCVFDYKRLAVFNGRRFVAVPVNFGKPVRPSPWPRGRTALRDRSGQFWFATDNGLFRFASVARIRDLAAARPAQIYDSHHGLTTDSVLMLYEDHHGDIWISSMSPWHPILTRWDHATDQFHEFSQVEGLPPDLWITDFGEDRRGDLWIAGSSVVRYRDGRFRRFARSDGLPTDSASSVYLDRAGRLWLATDTAGVLRIDDPGADHLHGVSYSTATGLASDQTFAITEDQTGRLYVVTGRGVDRLDVPTGALRHYTNAEGLVFGSLTLRDEEGTLWFGAANGLSRLRPTADIERAPPSAWIGHVSVEGVPRPVADLGARDAGAFSLSSTEHEVSIDFFGVGERLRYEYRLIGGEDRWSAPTDQRTVHYASLSSGRYRFEVRSVATDTGVRSSPATVVFIIPPPIWLRWWFLTLAGAALALTLYGLHRRRVAHLLEVERVRSRIARDLHDDLGANLSRVAILSEVAKQRIGDTDSESVSLLAEIADSSRNLMGSLRDFVWAIDPGGGSPADVETRVRQIAGPLLDPRGVAWRLHTDGQVRPPLDAEQRRHVILFFKEGINNAARYADASHVDLSISYTHDAIVCRVADNGRGFDVAAASTQGGCGVRNMHARATALGGHIEILSGRGAGTTLTVTIPLRRKRRGA